MSTNRPVTQDALNRIETMRTRVFKALEKSKQGKTIVLSEETLSDLWALLGNAAYTIGNLETELREALYQLNRQ